MTFMYILGQIISQKVVTDKEHNYNFMSLHFIILI